MRTLAQALMEVDVTAQIGAAHGERAPDSRVAQRNGYRPRRWDTRAGTVELAIPKLRQGGASYTNLRDATFHNLANSA